MSIKLSALNNQSGKYGKEKLLEIRESHESTMSVRGFTVSLSKSVALIGKHSYIEQLKIQSTNS